MRVGASHQCTGVHMSWGYFPLKRGDLSALKPSPCFSVWRNASTAWCPSVHEFHVTHRKALLKMPSPALLCASASQLDLDLHHFSCHGNVCRPRAAKGFETGERCDQIYLSHLWTMSFWGFIKGGINPEPEFNSSSTSQLFDLLHLFIMWTRTFEKELSRFEVMPRGPRTLWKSDGKEFAPVRLHYDILRVCAGCLAHGAWWK